MDDLAHDVPFNHRKRKADSDECPASSPVDTAAPQAIPDSQSVATAGPSVTAPRQTCLAEDTTMWPSPTSPQVSSPLSSHGYPSNPAKRPRLERIDTAWRAPKRPLPRNLKSPLKAAPSKPPPTVRHGNDIEDIGIVSTSDPGPSSGSLLHLRPGPKFLADPSSPVVPSIPIDTNSAHIPSLQPLINRQTLKELDLDAILRNPQLRALYFLKFNLKANYIPTIKQDMIYSSIPGCSFDLRAVVANATCPKSTGLLLARRLILGVPVCRSTCMGSRTPLSAPAHKYPLPPLALSSHTHRCRTSLRCECRRESVLFSQNF